MATKKNQVSDQQMVSGNWTCSECGAPITEMPFEPSPDRPIFCKDCWAKKRESRQKYNSGARKMFKGNWKCSECGAPITELPFEPNSGSPIFCRECWMKKRKER